MLTNVTREQIKLKQAYMVYDVMNEVSLKAKLLGGRGTPFVFREERRQDYQITTFGLFVFV